MENRFPCAKCGNCCKKLGAGDWTGISIFPWETHLFPKDSIKPNLGLGDTPEDPDFKTILYLYDSQECVHLDNDWCLIHDMRPIVCRSYPFRMSIQGTGRKIYEVAPECTSIKSWPDQSTVSERYEEMDAAELIGDHLHRFYKSDLPKWKYDKDHWAPIGKG
jgi:Fe-S-cluster containining protein